MKLSGWMMLVLIALVIFAAAGAAVLTVSWLGPVGGDRAAGVNLGNDGLGGRASPLGPVYHAGTFTVNLASSGRNNAFLRAEVVLEVDDRKTLEALEGQEPAVRDAIIVTLRSYTAAQLAEPEGILALRTELAEAISQLLPRGEIKQVYFREFITQ